MTAAPEKSQPSMAARASGATLAALSAGFGVGAIWATLHLRRTGELPLTPWGFRALSGPFERLGSDIFSALGLALAGLCALNVLAGVWLWRGERRGLRLSQATFGPAMILGVGFALPFLLIGLPITAALALAGRRNLGPRDGT